MSDNELNLPAVNPGAGMIATQQTRAQSEVQGMMIVAKRFPRDQMAAYNRILKSCQRKTLAEQALYAYPRGGQTITGPSIRLAEALAQNWGNLSFGIVELEQRDGESVMQSYCLDLETNCRQEKTFVVKHERDTKAGRRALTDNRDIYEMTANQGARRLRACILGIIPGDIVDAALDECEKTLKGQTKEPLIDRVRGMLAAFETLGVNQEMLEARLRHKLEVTLETELVNLRKIYTSIKDGASAREDWFSVAQAQTEAAGGVVDQLKSKVAQQAEQPPAETSKKGKPKNFAPGAEQRNEQEASTPAGGAGPTN